MSLLVVALLWNFLKVGYSQELRHYRINKFYQESCEGTSYDTTAYCYYRRKLEDELWTSAGCQLYTGVGTRAGKITGPECCSYQHPLSTGHLTSNRAHNTGSRRQREDRTGCAK